MQTLSLREEADDQRHLRSMDAFVRHVMGELVMIADAEQGLVIQQLVAALYEAAEKGKRNVMLNLSVLNDPGFALTASINTRQSWPAATAIWAYVRRMRKTTRSRPGECILPGFIIVQVVTRPTN